MIQSLMDQLWSVSNNGMVFPQFPSLRVWSFPVGAWK